MTDSVQKSALRRFSWFALLLFIATGKSLASEIILDINNTDKARGRVYVALCNEANFMRQRCDYEVARAASRGATVVSFTGVPPGDYAISAFYDLNGNQKLDKNLWGAPKEPVAFSNNASASYGAPEFAAARVTVEAGKRLRLQLELL